MIRSGEREMIFQEYFVAERCEPSVHGFRFAGAVRVTVTPAISDAIREGIAAVVICPSIPFVSIDPILAVPQFAVSLKKSGAPIVAVSSIVGGKAIKRAAAKMFKEQWMKCGALSIARHYAGSINGLVIDQADCKLSASIESLASVSRSKRPS